MKLTIAVTGLNNTDSPGPGIPVIRALRESKKFDVRIIGLAYENLEPGIYMDDVADKTYSIPYPSSGTQALLDRIDYINQKENIDVLFPNFDSELFTFIKSEEWLAQRGIKTFLPTLKQYTERDKNNLPQYGADYNLPIPKSIPISNLHNLSEQLQDIDYPVFVKGKFYEAYKAHDENELNNYFYKLSAKWGLPVIIQENITGTEVNVVALGDGKGNTIGAVPMRKTYITDKGKAWGGITLADEKMLEITRKIMKQTQWRGGMELEMIRTDEGEYYIIEINPRLPAWVYLAVGAGQNLPEALVQMAMGEEVAPFDSYKVGKMFIRYSFDLIGDISQLEAFSMNGEI